ncbi:MAG: cyclic nucleotide-binding domain-containing protein [Candidatus Eremiobacteraeota bacterium]|nr:cyclic nucleotide-binding domain-containing protein [Candidatus Eremiobacteraeota bacterium]MCW5872781.1 cyclic nucleotide-binding domain-containing protein [Candidatus Eremiobacteraeota bacterium]
MSSKPFSYRELGRGGQVVQWGDLHLQVGAYPETIKDTMTSSEGVPQIFVVPERLFDDHLGVSAAELEFPVYFNFYLKGRKLRFVCRKKQLRPLVRVLKEAIFGPSALNYAEEYAPGAHVPDLAAEMRWYKQDPQRKRGRLMLADIVTPLVFDEHGKVEIDGYTLQDLGQDVYRLERDGESHQFSYHAPGKVVFEEPPASQRFRPPALGMTILGSGHGFDARSLTSGFVIWIDGKGVLVDPPVHTTEWLRHSNIDGRCVEDIILTHCHADHDSGTLQKILQEGRVTIHTTPTVMHSFVSKYRSITNLSGRQFRQLFDFRAIPVGQPVNIAGADFTFKYMLHPIPTLGFSMRYQGRSIAYSCDTLYDPETIQKLTQEGILSAERAADLMDFPWHSDLVIHEAGIPPIHTPMGVLAALPDEVKQNLYLTHVSESAIPADSGLRLAPPGVGRTIRLEVEPPDVSHAQHMLEALAHVDLFQPLGIARAAEFLRISQYVCYPQGCRLVTAGEKGEYFHIILNGEADIVREGQLVKRVGRYDYIGEVAVVLDLPRIADVVAVTPLEVLSIKRQDFLDFIRGTEIADWFRRVSLNKMEGSWAVFQDNHLLDSLSTFQKTQLLAIMERRQFKAGQELFEKGEVVDSFWLVREGEIELGGHRVGRGALIGRVNEDLTPCLYRATGKVVKDAEVYRLPIDGVRAFFLANPGSFVRVLRLQSDHPVGAVV